MMLGSLVILLAAAAIFTVLTRSFVIINQYEQGLVFRYGRYIRKLQEGMNKIIPFVDTIAVVDMRIRTIDVPPQKVITKDNGVVSIEAVIYYRPLEAERLILTVAQYENATINLAQTAMRSIVGGLAFDELNANRDEINNALRTALEAAGESWGMEIEGVGIEKIAPASRSLNNALLKQMKAEREKRATILESEGMREAAIITAQGQKRGSELLGEGAASAMVNVSSGESEGIRIVSQEAKKISGNALSLWELNTWKTMSTSKTSTVVLPYHIKEWMKCMKGVEGNGNN